MHSAAAVTVDPASEAEPAQARAIPCTSGQHRRPSAPDVQRIRWRQHAPTGPAGSSSGAERGEEAPDHVGRRRRCGQTAAVPAPGASSSRAIRPPVPACDGAGPGGETAHLPATAGVAVAAGQPATVQVSRPLSRACRSAVAGAAGPGRPGRGPRRRRWGGRRCGTRPVTVWVRSWSDSRDSAKARLWSVASCTTICVGVDLVGLGDPQPEARPGRPRRCPARPRRSGRTGSARRACSGMSRSAASSPLRSTSKLPSLKIGQSWKISTSAVPRCAAAARSTAVSPARSESMARPTKRGLGAERHRDRVERVVDRPHRRRLGDLPDLGRRRVLALGQPVDPVVEQQDLEVDVAAQRVDQVVAADRQRVAVAGDDPHRQVGPGDREPGGDRRGPAVDGVHAVGVEVVREPRASSRCRRRTRCSRGGCPAWAGTGGPRPARRSRRSRGTSAPPGRR